MKKLRKYSPLLIIGLMLFNIVFEFNLVNVSAETSNNETKLEMKDESHNQTTFEIAPPLDKSIVPSLPELSKPLKTKKNRLPGEWKKIPQSILDIAGKDLFKKRVAPISKKRTSKGKVSRSNPVVVTPRAGERKSVDGNQYVTNSTFTTENGTPIYDGDEVGFNTEYRLFYEWELPDGEFREGDVLVFTIPPELLLDDIFDFNVESPNGEVVGTAYVRGDSKKGYRLEFELTDYVERNSATGGEFEFATHLNETYIIEGGEGVIEFPDHDLEVIFPEPEEGGTGGDGSGYGSQTKLQKTGKIINGEDGIRYVEWRVTLGYKAIFGNVNAQGDYVKVFDSFDDIESITLEDEPRNQRIVSGQEAYGWSEDFAYHFMYWPASSWGYGHVYDEEAELFDNDTRMVVNLKDPIKRLADENPPGEEFNEYTIEYYAMPLNPLVEQDLDNKATVTIKGKNNGEEIKYTLKSSVKWTTGGGTAGGGTGRVKLIKTDSDSGDFLENAEFDLYQRTKNGWDLENINLITDDDGEIIISNLKVGEYKFVETNPPEGYGMPEDNEFEFEISREDIKEGRTKLVEVENTRVPDRRLLFIKEGKKGTPIKQPDSAKRAEFILQVKNGSTWKQANNKVYQVDENGEILLEEDDFKDLDADKYYRFMETKAPYGYELPNSGSNEAYSEEFHLEEYSINGIVTNEDEDPVTIKMQNKKLNHQLNFKKSIEFNTGQNTPTSSEGIKFVIQGRNNGDWERYSGETFVTDKNGMIHIDSTTHPDFIQGMVDSNYQYFRFRESEVPPGRGLVDPQYPATGKEKDGKPGSDFSVAIPIDELRTNTNKGTNQVVDNLTLENKLIRYKATLQKIDSVNGNQLKGAEFTVYEKDKPNDKRVIKETNGVFEIDDLVIGREYVVVESKAPEGYGARTDEYLIKLDLNNQMKVSKKDETGKITVLEEGSNKDYTWDGTNLNMAMKVKNTAMPKMPMTGGIGVTLYTLSSLLFILIGSLLFITIKKGEKRHGKRK